MFKEMTTLLILSVIATSAAAGEYFTIEDGQVPAKSNDWVYVEAYPTLNPVNR